MAEVLKDIEDSSIDRVTGSESACALFDKMQQAAKGTNPSAQCCPFLFLLPPCKKAANDSCQKCGNGIKEMPDGLLDLLLPKLTQSLQRQITLKRERFF